MNIIIKHCIDQKAMRNPGDVGDYWEDKDGWHIRTSLLKDWRHEMLIAIHEMIELSLLIHRDIPEPVVMRFDLEHPELDDPGADPRSPYHAEHMFALQIERQIAEQLGVDWDEYEKACAAVVS